MFRQLVLARSIEATSKYDSLWVLAEAGIEAVSYATVKRRLQRYADDTWRRELAAACAAHAQLGPASLVLYDVSTLYFETDAGDGFREPVLQGTPARAAGHDRVAHRHGRVPTIGALTVAVVLGVLAAPLIPDRARGAALRCHLDNCSRVVG